MHVIMLSTHTAAFYYHLLLRAYIPVCIPHACTCIPYVHVQIHSIHVHVNYISVNATHLNITYMYMYTMYK